MRQSGFSARFNHSLPFILVVIVSVSVATSDSTVATLSVLLVFSFTLASAASKDNYSNLFLGQAFFANHASQFFILQYDGRPLYFGSND